MADVIAGIAELFKAGFLLSCGISLLYSWHHAQKRYYKDIPFLMGYFYTFWGFAEMFEAIMIDLNVFGYDAVTLLWLLKFRLGVLSVVNFLPFIYMILSVFQMMYPKINNKVIVATMGTHVTVWEVLCWTGTTAAEVNRCNILSLWVIGAFITIFALTHRYKRLPNVHSLILSISGFLIIVGQAMRPMFVPLGMLWLNEVADAIAFGVQYIGLKVKPSYAKMGAEDALTATAAGTIDVGAGPSVPGGI